MLKVLSWGVGLQSTTLLEMSIAGELPKLDAAIFADTGYEHGYTYEIYNFYAPRAISAGIKIIKIGDQHIFKDTYSRVTLPLFVGTTGRKIKRMCTRDYKIRPVQRVIRDLLGVKRRGRLKADLVELWLGITVDEIDRAKDSRVSFIRHEFPLLDLKKARGDCSDYLKSKGLPVPGKSSCIFCPYKKSKEWVELRDNDPVEFSSIANLEQHINAKKMIRLDGEPKSVSFVSSGSLLHSDLISLEQENLDGFCDGGFCHV